MRRMMIPTDVAELRAEDGESAVPVIRGYAAVFDAETELWPGTREVIRRGAFSKTLAEGDQVALWNHDTNKPLARRTAGTLKLAEDDRGLRYEFEINVANSWERDAFEAVKKRSVIGSSFAFEPVRESVQRNEKGRMVMRELLEVKLFEVSPVTFPAYKATEAQARALFSELTHPSFDLSESLEKFFAQGLTPAQVRASCHDVIELLDRGDWGSASEAAEAERDSRLRRLRLIEAEL